MCSLSEVVKRFLLYARRSEIRGVDIDNPYINIITAVTAPDINDVTAVDYDGSDERIYWADVKTRTIKRASINGTKLEVIVSGGTVCIDTFWMFLFISQCSSFNFFKSFETSLNTVLVLMYKQTSLTKAG